MTSTIVAVPVASGWMLRYKHGRMLGGLYSSYVYPSKREAESNIL
jgi:hypothetical protein